MDSTWKQLIYADLARIDRPTCGNLLKHYFMPGGSTFQYNVWFRALQQCKKQRVKKYTVGLFAYAMYSHMGRKYGIHANANIPVGPGLLIVHGDGVYLNCQSIGKNFTVYQCATLGSVTLDRGEIPTVGDDVTVYTGAVVAGGVTLHTGAVVAANAYVNTDVAAGIRVGGLPAKRIG